MDITAAHLIVFAAFASGGIVGGAACVGGLLIAMPIMLTALSPAEAVLTACLVAIAGDPQLAYAYRRSFRWRDLRDLVVGVVPGTFLGGQLLKVVSMQTLQFMLCGVMVSFLLLQCWKKVATYRLPEKPAVGVAAGLVCGLAGASTGFSGPPLSLYVLLKGWDADRARGNMSMFYFLCTMTTAASQAFAGLYSGSLLVTALFGVAGCLLGQGLGVRLGRHIDQRMFRRIVLFFILFSTLSLLYRTLGL